MARPAMGGPGRRGQMAGGKRSKNPKKTLGRLLYYIRDGYAVQFGVVLVCILISAVVNVAGSMFLRVLIDDYIAPVSYTHLVPSITSTHFSVCVSMITAPSAYRFR